METAINAIKHNPDNGVGIPDAFFAAMSGAPFPFSPPSTDKGISHYWRKNTSSIESVELANLLRALRKVAGHLGVNTGRIEYTGMSTGSENSILIEPEMVMGTYPVPGETVDHLVGLVVHEALHRIEWTDHVWNILEPEMNKMSPIATVAFQKMVHTGEDIYVDCKSDQTVFGLYTKIVRNQALFREIKKVNTGSRSVDALLLFWMIQAFTKKTKNHIPGDYYRILHELKFLTAALGSVATSSARLIRRCEQRAGFYLDVWDKIGNRVKGWKIINKQLCWFTSVGESRSEKKVGSSQNPQKSKNRIPMLVREIETRLSADSVDMTPLIRSIVGYENESVEPMSRWDFKIASHPVIDRKMTGRLRSTFSSYADRNVLVSRGLSSGRIDRRRLGRALVNGKCFKTTDSIPNLNWSVGLLVDASGSMRGNKWQIVENTIATIHRALNTCQNRLSAWAYFEVNGICMISRLIEKNRLYSVPPSGQTASGQAIIAAAAMMPDNVKRNILIHITDGESNFGCDVSYGIEYCRQQQIHLITLACGYQDKEAMQDQYGRTIQFIDYFEQLPKAIESLFRWTFLYGGRRTCPLL